MEFPEPDNNTKKWFHFRYECDNNKIYSSRRKYPTAKYTIKEVEDLIKPIQQENRELFYSVFNKYIPEEKENKIIIQWLEHEIDATYKTIVNCIWLEYSHALYLDFRKYINERTLAYSSKTILNVKILDNIANLHISSAFSDINKQKAVDYFVNMKGLKSVNFVS